MKIRTVLLLSSASLIVFSLLIGAVVFVSTQRTEGFRRQRTLADTAVNQVFQLHILAQDYVSHHDERPKAQWYLQYDRLLQTLGSPVLKEPPSASYIDRLEADAFGIKQSFDAQVAQAMAEADPAIQEQASNDLLLKTQHMILDVGEMADEDARVRTETRAMTDRLVFILLVVLALVSNAILLLLYRRIVGPILRLRKGADVVGQGNLDHRIGSASPDEIGQLSRAFDAMTAKLKDAHEHLEDKIKERTRELHEMSHRNEVLLESIGDGVIAIDRFWNITLWNPATARLTGWSEEEALGKPFRERVHFIREHDRKENLTFIEEAMLYGEVKQMSNSTLLLARDGREVPVSDSAAPIFDVDGTVKGVIIVFRDATKEKESSLLRTDFAYASHQLRTPVNKALWNLETLLEEPADAEAKERLKVAYRGVLDVQKLAERLLMVSEIDQRRMVPEFREIELPIFFKDLIDQERKAAEKRAVDIALTALPAGAKMDADPKLLAEAIHEMVQNAVMYSPAGGKVEVDVQLEPLRLILRVRDRGIGISEEQAPLVFTKFFRGQNVPADAAGAGLGLFIAREYARMMGGKLWFESKLGEGSTFIFSIPRLRGMKE